MKALEYLLSKPLMVTPEARDAALAIVTREPGRNVDMLSSKSGRQYDGARSGMQVRDRVAVIPVVGPIFRYADMFTELCGGITTEALAQDIRAATENPGVDSILMVFDSPGGEATSIAELAAYIREATDQKPVVAYADGTMASAAYYLGSAASDVVLAPTSIVGSIGVVMGFQTREDRAGTKSYTFISSQSPNKRIDPESADGAARVQQLVDDLASVFVADVAKYRDVSVEDVLSKFGAGGVLVGQKAVDAGMADRIGSFESLLSELTDRAAGGQRSVFSLAAAGREEGDISMGLFGFKFKPDKDGSVKVEFDQPEQAQASTPPPASPAPPPPNSEASDVHSATIAALRKQLAEAKLETIKAEALGWYKALAAAEKVVPAEKDAALAAYVAAAVDDLEHPRGDGSKRTASVEAIYAARTPHTLTREQLDGTKKAPNGSANGHSTLKASDDVNPENVKAILQGVVDAGMATPKVLQG